jgi:thioredoxin-like negative regulator of GroEL
VPATGVSTAELDRPVATAARHGDQGIAQLIVVEDGREVDRVVGAVPAARLRELLQRDVARAAAGAAGAGS